jgi:prepilin-type N-terminal cleavage/methylation domain-containing protein
MKRLRNGFTLLELTVAMAMVSMLMLSMYTALSVTIRAKRSATAAVAPTRAGTLAADMIAQDLQTVLPPTGLFAGAFIGTQQMGPNGGRADTLEFYCIGSDAGATGSTALGATSQESPLAEGIRRVDLLIHPEVQPPALVRQVSRNLLPTVQPPPEEEILCRGVRSLTIRYFDGEAWQDSWDSTGAGDVLPLAVSVTLEVNDPQSVDPMAKPLVVSRVIPLACAKPLDAQIGIVP